MANPNTSRLVSVAPMMDYTDRHDRYFLRLISPDVLLYTEMITALALEHGNVDYLLAYDASEHPVALQLGGSDPNLLAKGAKLGESYGYDEINLNVGCPSPRVSAGRFGACLMLEPEWVADCVSTMQAQVSIPVTVKCRTGVDEQDSYEQLHHFISTLASAGCKTFIIHARKAWLSGLSPRQNREIPPLQYETVYQIKKDFPGLTVIINGGIQSVSDIDRHLPHVDGVMIGRAAYSNPYLLAEIQSKYFKFKEISDRHAVIKKFLPYIHEQVRNGIKLSAITRHILGLFQGQRGAAAWRRHLSQHAHQPDADIHVIETALSLLQISI
ncbi:tRNA-dihydrouridine synthase A [Aquicella siphonis]|uniref:tRNA-dihydrouridine(20/20a) synthase n=1 Tax=Aquicella siphonis TaxID=254247 RepID=A0A5E4PHK5_9COXI|nr:tRNA dihydrouridine(20/20a) synthase DusA [Aquicella siphonis]VVC75932.1 tRNA-dihydrouridine synthase A [Aquicella siphonis]